MKINVIINEIDHTVPMVRNLVHKLGQVWTRYIRNIKYPQGVTPLMLSLCYCLLYFQWSCCSQVLSQWQWDLNTASPFSFVFEFYAFFLCLQLLLCLTFGTHFETSKYIPRTLFQTVRQIPDFLNFVTLNLLYVSDFFFLNGINSKTHPCLSVKNKKSCWFISDFVCVGTNTTNKIDCSHILNL